LDNNSPYKSLQKLETAHLERLCKGTKTPHEPGECFHKVISGQAGSQIIDKDNWENVITFCAGTDNSDERISCLKTKIDAGEKQDK
jgi:hypothetical protein